MKRWRTRYAFLRLRNHSLLRGNVLVLASLLASFVLAGFPRNRANAWIAVPALLSIVGMVDTLRCMQSRWSWYHGGVLLCLYMDLMAVTMIFFFLLYPYARWIIASH